MRKWFEKDLEVLREETNSLFGVLRNFLPVFQLDETNDGVADAFLELFGGDNLLDIQANYRNYLKRISA